MSADSHNSESQDENNRLLGEMTSKVSFSFIVNVLGALLGYVIIALANKLIGVEEYGEVIFALSFAGFFSFLTDLGFSKAHIKHISSGHDEASAISVFAIIKFVLTGIFAFSVILSLSIWEMVGGGYESQETISIIYIVLTYFIFTNLGSIFSFTYSARRDVLRYHSSPFAEITSRVLATIIVVLYSLGALGLAYTWMIAGIGYVSAAIIVYKGPKFAWPDRNTFFSIFRKYRKFALPLALSLSIVIISQYFDKILIKLFFTSTEVALFFAPQRLLSLFLAIATSINLMLFPLLSEIHARSNSDIAGRFATRSLFYISLVVLPLATFAFAFAAPLLEIYIKPEYLEATTLFRILIIANVLTIIAGSGTNLLLGIGKSVVAAKLGIAVGLSILALDLVLIPPSGSLPISIGMGINGAAISLLIAGMIRIVGTITFVYRLTSFRIPGRLLSILAVSILSSAIPYYLLSVFSAVRFYDVILYFALNIVLYMAFIRLFNVVSREEFHRLVSIFSPRAFIGFLKS